MSIVGSLLSGKSYIAIVKTFIGKLFIHEEKKYNTAPGGISIILQRSREEGISILTYSNVTNEVLRTIPGEEAQEILTS